MSEEAPSLQGPECKLDPRPPSSRTRSTDKMFCSERSDSVIYQNQPMLGHFSVYQVFQRNINFFILGSLCIWLTESKKQDNNWLKSLRSLGQPHRWIRPSWHAFLFMWFRISQQYSQAHVKLVLECLDSVPWSLLPTF